MKPRSPVPANARRQAVYPGPRPKRPEPPASRKRDLLTAALVYLVATVVLTYPLALHPASLGRFDNGDARLNAWAISWVARQIVRDPLHLFEANTFYPLPHSLAYSEHLLAQGLMALPLLRATDDLVLTNNLILLFSIWLSAMGGYLLVLTLTGNHLAALLCGLFFSFAPFRFNRLPHLQMQLYAFLPLMLACLHRFTVTGRRVWAGGVAAFFLLQVLSGTYLAAMAAVALGCGLLTLLPGASLSRREIGFLAAALALSSVIVYLVARPYLWVHRTLGVEWDLEGIGSLSATPSSYLASSSHLYGALTAWLLRDAPPRDYLFPGLTLLVLGAIGLGLLLRARGSFRSPRRWALCYVTILAVGLLLSLGPAIPGYSVLYEKIVFFRGLRALTRFGLLPLLSLSVLSGFALAWLFEGPWRLRPRAAFAVAAFFVAESTALPYGLTTFRDEPEEVYTWLGREAGPGPIVELPFKVLDTRYMFWARHHHFRPTLNGDSGFIPISHQWMKVLFLRFPSEDAMALLRRLEVRYLVLHIGAYRGPALVRLLNGLEEQRHGLLPVRDFGRTLVFEVVPRPGGRTSPTPPGPAISISGQPSILFDGHTTSGWTAPGRRTTLSVELDSERPITAVRIHYGPHPRSPVEQLSIERVDPDGASHAAWKTDDDWPALTELISSLLDDPTDGIQTLDFAPFEARRVTIHLEGRDGPPELTELELLGVDPS